MSEKTPSQLPHYESGTDYRLHAHKAGESVGVSIDDLSPAGGVILSKRNLESTGLYYECSGQEIDAGTNPVLDALFLETDAKSIALEGSFNTGYRLNRTNKAMAKDALSNDLLVAREDDSLVRITEASEYDAAEMTTVSTNTCGVDSTSTRNYLYKTNGDLVVVNSDNSERTIAYVDGDQFFAGACTLGAFDYVAVGKRIYKINDSSIEIFLTELATIRMFCATNANMYFVKAGAYGELFKVSSDAEVSQMTEGFNAPFSSIGAYNDTIFALESGETGHAFLQMSNDVQNEFKFNSLMSVNKQKNIIPLSDGAAIVYVDSEESEDNFHWFVRNYTQTSEAYAANVVHFFSNGGKDYARIGDQIFINAGANEVNTYPYDTIYRYSIEMPDPTKTAIPFIFSSVQDHNYYIRRG